MMSVQQLEQQPPPYHHQDPQTQQNLMTHRPFPTQSSSDSTQLDQNTRLSIIQELITGEIDYLDDLNTYQSLFIVPLQDSTPPTIFQRDFLEKFSSKVFSTILEIKDHHQSFLNQILNPNNFELIPQLILTFALQWSNLYTSYAKDHPFGEFQIEQQLLINPLFAEMIQSIPRKNPQKKDFRHFYSRPTLRLARYSLLLNRLLEFTPKDHVDFTILTLAVDIIKNQCQECNSLIELQQARLNLLKLNKSIINKLDHPALHLKASSRKLFCTGEMIKKKEGSLNNFIEVNGILIDHYFIITKPVQKPNQSITYYEIIEEPIRLEFMKLSKVDDQPAQKKVNKLKHFLANNSNSHHTNQPMMSNLLFPITFQSFGVSPRTITIYLENEQLRSFWVTKFNEAIYQRLKNFKQSEIFKLLPILNFNTPSSHQTEFHSKLEGSNHLFSHNSADEQLLRSETQTKNPTPLYGIPTCSTQFISQDGNNVLVIGCQEGLWIGQKHQPNSFQFILPNLRNIQQCQVLIEFDQILILSDSQLFLYPLNQFLKKPSRDRSNSSPVMNKPLRPLIPYRKTYQTWVEPTSRSYFDSNHQEFRNLKNTFKRQSFRLVKKSDSTSSSSSSLSSNSNSTSSSNATMLNSFTFDSNPYQNIKSSDPIFEERKCQTVRENQRNFRKLERNHEVNLPILISESNKEVPFFKVGRLTDLRTILTYVEISDSGSHLIILELKMIESFPNFTELKKINLQSKKIQEIKFFKDQLMIIEKNSKEFLMINLLNSQQDMIKTYSIFSKNDSNLLSNQRFKKLIKSSGSLLNVFEIEDRSILFCFDRFGYFGNLGGIRDKSKPILEWESHHIKSFKMIPSKQREDSKRDQYLIIIGSNSMIEIWDLIRFEKVQEVYSSGKLVNHDQVDEINDDLVFQIDETIGNQQQNLYQIDEDQIQSNQFNQTNQVLIPNQNSTFKVLQLFQP
ncbi:hypothetical protein DFH28DRAFT_1031258 [Melampsora americana]|nr:hypothetical protein DFH28DRAFT_1031258 [Melampsora americana]